MTTFVLVPGFWLGGWAWSDVTTPLRAAGHQVYPLTLTGLGEREHLASPQVDLDTHITDVINTLVFEDLHKVVLVGHSYGGVVVTGVTDRVPERIAHVIYVDSAPLPDGAAQVDFSSSEARAEYEQRVAAQDDSWRLRLPTWEELDQGSNLDGLDAAMRERMRTRATDQPLRTALQPLRLSNPARAQLRKTAIWCTFSSAQVREMIAAGMPMFSELAGPEWQFIDLPTGHWPMFSRPDDLAQCLLDAV